MQDMKIPERVFDITCYGAIPGGSTPCTGAIALAVQACIASGGGTVYIPEGEFLTGPIQVGSNMSLHLAAGAKLIFICSKDEYPLIHTRWEGSERKVHVPLIYGRGLENVAITGEGTLDGQGAYWWDLFRKGSLEYPRPRFVSFEESSGILVKGVRLVNSPAWTVNPVRCENIKIEGISIFNPSDSPNTDGVNPDSCRNVHYQKPHLRQALREVRK